MAEKIIAHKKIGLMSVVVEKNHGSKKAQVEQELGQQEGQFGEVVV